MAQIPYTHLKLSREGITSGLRMGRRERRRSSEWRGIVREQSWQKRGRERERETRTETERQEEKTEGRTQRTVIRNSYKQHNHIIYSAMNK